jgi:hypothetical protein
MRKLSDRGGKAIALFARDEYQSNSGNLPHNHFVLAIDRSEMENPEEFIQDLIRTSPFDIVRPSEVEHLIEEKLISGSHEMMEITNDGACLLPHICSDRCKMRVGVGDGPKDTQCRKPHNTRDSPDPTKNCFIKLPFKYRPEFNALMEKMGFCNITEDQQVEYNLPFFRPTRHMPACIPNDPFNMSPVISSWFIACRSMINAQFIGARDVISKYLLKYVVKFDLTERIETKVNSETGAPQIGKEFLFNTKITRSAVNEEKKFQKSKNAGNPRFLFLHDTNILHKQFLYADIITNLRTQQISTQTFEVRTHHKIDLMGNGAVARGRDRNGFERAADEHIDEIWIDKARRSIAPPLHTSQMLTQSQLDILFDDRVDSRKYDSISEFGIRPPELIAVFKTVLPYFRICDIDRKFIPDLKDMLSTDLNICCWIDGFGRQVRIRKSTIPEIEQLITTNLEELNDSNYTTLRGSNL